MKRFDFTFFHRNRLLKDEISAPANFNHISHMGPYDGHMMLLDIPQVKPFEIPLFATRPISFQSCFLLANFILTQPISLPLTPPIPQATQDPALKRTLTSAGMLSSRSSSTTRSNESGIASSTSSIKTKRYMMPKFDMTPPLTKRYMMPKIDVTKKHELYMTPTNSIDPPSTIIPKIVVTPPLSCTNDMTAYYVPSIDEMLIDKTTRERADTISMVNHSEFFEISNKWSRMLR